MLMDSLSQSIKKMKQMEIVENAALDAEKKAKNEADYRTVVSDFSNTVDKLHQAVKTLDYSVTEEAVQNLEESLDKLDEVVTAGVVDADHLSNARQQINRKVNPGLAQEWKSYHQKIIKQSISKLNTLGNLVASPDKIESLRTNLSNGGEWAGLSLSDDGTHTRLFLFKDSIDTINKFEENLNLSEEIKNFIVKVTINKARISDLSETVISWIKTENLEDRFIITFRD